MLSTLLDTATCFRLGCLSTVLAPRDYGFEYKPPVLWLRSTRQQEVANLLTGVVVDQIGCCDLLHYLIGDVFFRELRHTQTIRSIRDGRTATLVAMTRAFATSTSFSTHMLIRDHDPDVVRRSSGDGEVM